MKEISVIITAGGIGKRMGAEMPKQFLLLNGKPILLRTLEQMYKFLSEAQFILTLPEEWKSEWSKLCTEYNCSVPHKVISGGEERFHSVKNALQECTGEYVFIHDGVRPLVSSETVQRGLKSLENHLASVPTTTIVESVRQVVDGKNKAVNRGDYRNVQTPQCFHSKVISKAYEVDFSSDFTDDASVMEKAGHSIYLFDGNRENIKITEQSDLSLAEYYWSVR